MVLETNVFHIENWFWYLWLFHWS